MNNILKWESFNEKVKNVKLATYYAKQICTEIEKTVPGSFHNETTTNTDYELTVNVSFPKGSNNTIEKILNKWYSKLLRAEYILSFEINEHNEVIFYIKDLYVKRAHTPRFIYHVSDPENRESIIENGLVPKDGSKWAEKNIHYPPAVFATDSPEERKLFNYENDSADIWEIDTEKIPNTKWWLDLNFHKVAPHHIMTFDAIPPTAIKLFKPAEEFIITPDDEEKYGDNF